MTVDLVITLIRVINALVGAAFTALLWRATWPVRGQLGAAEKWLAAALLVYSANVTVFCALFWTSPASGRSWINVGFLLSLLAAHRYLYFVRRDTRP
ncbi:hypothetical protein [Streptomyces sp. NPDC002088]|uniref:hypothetical protein n=1 Tax=Streptomyces sp. NPDC002088 TaxID=3154665 RepID=UPI003332E440